MQRNTLTPPVELNSDSGSGTVFNVLIAYEDFETGKSAKRVYDVLLEHLGSECQLSSQMWKFDVLTIPKLLEMATRDAESADILVVSCHGTDDLPPVVTRWLEAGLTGNAIALVGLFDPEGESAHPAREYLAAAAKRAGIQFFARPDESPNPSPWGEPGSVQQVPRLDTRTLSMLAGMVRQDSFPSRTLDE